MSGQQQLWLIWGAMLATIVVYSALPRFVAFGDPGAPPAPAALGTALDVAGALLGMGAIALRRALLLGPAQQGVLDVSTPEGFARARTGYVVCWALAESVALVGLVLSLLTRDAARMQPFLLAALLLFVFLVPRLEMLRLGRRV